MYFDILPWRHFRAVLSSINPTSHKHNFLSRISLQTSFPDVPLHWASISHSSYSCLSTEKYKVSLFYLFFKQFLYFIRYTRYMSFWGINNKNNDILHYKIHIPCRHVSLYLIYHLVLLHWQVKTPASFSLDTQMKVGGVPVHCSCMQQGSPRDNPTTREC